MINRFFILSLFLILPSQVISQANITDSNIVSDERFEYSLHYGIFKIGKAKLSYTQADSSCGYSLYAEAKTTGLVKLFRHLSYIFDCCMDIEKYVNIETYFWDEVYDLKIKYMGKEMIKSKFGTMECLKVNPRTDIGRFFRTNDDMSIWFTNDNDHIPVKLIIDLKFGTIKAHLTKQIVEERL